MLNFPPFTIRCFTGQPVPFDFTDGRLRATVSDTQYSVTLDVPNRQVWLHTPIERVPFAIYPAQEAQAWRLLKALAHAEEIGARPGVDYAARLTPALRRFCMFCKSCGHELADNARQCPACGHSYATSVTAGGAGLVVVGSVLAACKAPFAGPVFFVGLIVFIVGRFRA